MKTVSITLIVSAIGLAFVLASPAEAAKKKPRHQHHAGRAANAMAPGATTAQFQNGVMAGPLYNGQDYIGDDPDPNVRAYLLRDMTRYRGSY